jgi:uracil-DNA glycosylase
MLAELEAIRPEVMVLLGSTAAKSLLGNDFRVTPHRGEVLALPSDSGEVRNSVNADVVVTVHPSAVLRGPVEARDEAFDALVADLRVAGRALAKRSSSRQLRLSSRGR